MNICIAKKCCNQGFKSALKLKKYLEANGYKDVSISSKKYERFEEEFKKYGIENDFIRYAVLILDGLNGLNGLKVYLPEDKIDEWMKGN